MSNPKTRIQRRVVALALSICLLPMWGQAVLASDNDLNFKVYSPDSGNAAGATTPTEQAPSESAPATSEPVDQATNTPASPQDATPQATAPTLTPTSSATTPSPEVTDAPLLNKEIPVNQIDTSTAKDTAKPATGEEEAKSATPAPTDDAISADKETPTKAASDAGKDTASDKTEKAESASGSETADSDSEEDKASGKKVLKGYVRVVPTGTKIPIIMDTAVDSDTSQEGDEFSARTAEDLTIDGTTAVPAGSIIRGRIASINPPKHLDRSGSVGLKFDTVTTPDNRQIPLVANLVARGGVVHARRGMKDIAIDTGVAGLPMVVGVGIGAVAGHSSSSSHIGAGGGALIGAGIGVAVGVAVLLAKKGKKVDVRPGDELKIELAEDLHMPTM